jgi:hypothetical protein
VVIDEGNFAPDQWVANVALPLYMTDGVSIIFMSSPLRRPCLMNYLTTVKDVITGKLLFKTILLSEVCAECKKTSNPEFCEHMVAGRSELKTQERISTIAQAYPPKYAPIRDQEIYGVTKRTSNNLPAEVIDYFMQHIISVKKPIGFVCIGIDPGGGGASHTGFTTFAHYPTLDRPDMRVVSFSLFLFFFISCACWAKLDDWSDCFHVDEGYPIMIIRMDCATNEHYLPMQRSSL